MLRIMGKCTSCHLLRYSGFNLVSHQDLLSLLLTNKKFVDNSDSLKRCLFD